MQQKFSQLVRDARTNRGLSQRALADLLSRQGLSIDASGINRIELGSREPRLNEIRQLVSVLGLDRESVLSPDPDAETLGNQAAAREHLLEARRAASSFIRYFAAIGNTVVADSYPDVNPAARALRLELEKYVDDQEPATSILCDDQRLQYYDELLKLVIRNIVIAKKWDVSGDDEGPDHESAT